MKENLSTLPSGQNQCNQLAVYTQELRTRVSATISRSGVIQTRSHVEHQVVTAKVLNCQETTERWFQTNFAYFHHIRYQNKENLKSMTDPLCDSLRQLKSRAKFFDLQFCLRRLADAAGNA